MKAVGVTAVLLIAACGSDAPLNFDDRSSSEQKAPGALSLFPNDAQTLSDESIGRVLGFQLRIPARAKLVTLQLGGPGVYRWSNLPTGPNEASLIDSALAVLRGSPRLRSAAPLPALFLPERITVAMLREAAARLQADLLFLYRPDCETFHSGGVWRAKELRATCSVEGLLLDVRSGLVPFTTVAAERLTVTKPDNRESAREAVLGAEIQTLGKALGRATQEATAFLTTIDTLQVRR